MNGQGSRGHQPAVEAGGRNGLFFVKKPQSEHNEDAPLPEGMASADEHKPPTFLAIVTNATGPRMKCNNRESLVLTTPPGIFPREGWWGGHQYPSSQLSCASGQCLI